MPDKPHNNRHLFSDNYLSRHLPELVGDELDAAREVQRRLRAIYEYMIDLKVKELHQREKGKPI